MKVALENTYVRYEDFDHLGKLLAYVTLTPVYIMAMYTTLLLFRRDYSTLFSFSGQMINLVLNKVLKKIFDQPRPGDNSDLSDSGMPSNHSQFMGYICTYYIIQFLFNSPKLTVVYRLFYSLLLCTLCLAVCYSRHYLEYHTVDQIIVGALIGSSFGFFYALFDVLYGYKLGNLICSIPVIDYFGVRNFSPLEEYMKFRHVPNKRSH